MTQRDAQRYIAKGRLFVDGVPMKEPSGDVEGLFQCVMFEPVSRGIEPLFQTDAFVLFDKPSGVLVHPQNRHTPYSMIDEIRFRFGSDANIAHRIDQETSGLLLAATTKASERDLKMMFENRQMQKRYLAFVRGRMKEGLRIEAPLIRREDDSAMVRMIVKVHTEGKASQTDIRVLKYYPEKDITLVEARPLTGRQHQIRVHLFHIGHPIVGDPIYGQKEEDAIRFLDRELSAHERFEKSGAHRLLLHAYALEFEYMGIRYLLKSRMDFETEAMKAMDVSRET